MSKSSPLSQQKIVVSADPDKTVEDFAETQWEALDNKKIGNSYRYSCK